MDTSDKTILIIGTADTKAAELQYLRECVNGQSCRSLLMDVSVLDNSDIAIDYSKHHVCSAADTTIDALIEKGDENFALQQMARGASKLTLQLYFEGTFDGVIILGGTMGTDLALDVTCSLPIGVPKIILSTIAFSHLIPPHRLASDLTMILWSGGLYGLNSFCKSSLSSAAGAACGAARSVTAIDEKLPKVAISSFGNSAAKWMKILVPALQQRGFEATVFHATGMGGRALEHLATKGHFVAVLDLALQEITNHYFNSSVTSGPDRLTNAGLKGIPQIVAPGFIDLIDLPCWQEPTPALQNRNKHDHNRLLTSLVTTAQERREIIKIIAQKLKLAKGKVSFILPTQGIHEWDRVGAPLRDEAGIRAVNEAAIDYIRPLCDFYELQAHINDSAFNDLVLQIFDKWVTSGIISNTNTTAKRQ